MSKRLRNILGGLAGASGVFDGGLQISRRDATALEPLRVEGLTVACQCDWPAAEAALARQWDTLIDSSAGTAFHTRAWQRAAADATGAGRPLRLVSVCDGQGLVGLLPLVCGDGALATPGAAVSDYLDPLIRGGCETGACRALLRFLRGAWDRRVRELVFHNVRADAPSRAALLAEAPVAGFIVEETLIENTPIIALPNSWEAFLDSLDTHERKELRRKMNKAPDAQLIACRSDDQIAAALPKAIELMASRAGEKRDAVERTLCPLLTAVAPSMIRQNRLDLLTLQLEGQTAACLLQFPSPSGPMLYNCGVDYSLKEWSPGVVAIALAIQRAITAGCATYDMLRGQEAYKYKFGAKDRGLYRMVMKV